MNQSALHRLVCTGGKKRASVNYPVQQEECCRGQIKTKDDTIDSFIHTVTCIQNTRAPTSVQLFSSNCIFTLQEEETLSVSFIEPVLPSLTPVLQSREVSRQHRLDVKALALMCAEVHTLQRLNEADFYLPM